VAEEGLLETGNIDLEHRPVVKNKDGSISTVRSMSFNEGNQEILVPTIGPKGQRLTDEQAIQYYHDTGQHLGKFSSPDAATRYAKALHEEQAKKYSTEGKRVPEKKLTEAEWRDRYLKAIQMPTQEIGGGEEAPAIKMPTQEMSSPSIRMPTQEVTSYSSPGAEKEHLARVEDAYKAGNLDYRTLKKLHPATKIPAPVGQPEVGTPVLYPNPKDLLNEAKQGLTFPKYETREQAALAKEEKRNPYSAANRKKQEEEAKQRAATKKEEEAVAAANGPPKEAVFDTSEEAPKQSTTAAGGTGGAGGGTGGGGGTAGGYLPNPRADEAEDVHNQLAAAYQKGGEEESQSLANEGLGLAMQADITKTQSEKEYQQAEELRHHKEKMMASMEQANADAIALSQKKVDPGNLWANMDTGQRVVALLGLMMGGFSAGVTGGKNEAMEALQRAIDRDIDAQKTNLENERFGATSKQSMYAKQLALLGDPEAAEHAARGTAWKAVELQAQNLAKITASKEALAKGNIAGLESLAKFEDTMALADERRKANKGVGQGLPGGEMNLQDELLVHLPTGKTVMTGTKEQAELIKGAVRDVRDFHDVVSKIKAIHSDPRWNVPGFGITKGSPKHAELQSLGEAAKRIWLQMGDKVQVGTRTNLLAAQALGDPASIIGGARAIDKLNSLEALADQGYASILKASGAQEVDFKGYHAAGKFGNATPYGAVKGTLQEEEPKKQANPDYLKPAGSK
jgi:hypothetical protein